MNPFVPTLDSLSALQEKVNAFGPRFTGNDDHKAFIRFIREELEAAGLEVHEDTYSFDRWETLDWGLSILTEGGEEELPVSFYYPYSGETGPEGAEAPLVWLGSRPGSYRKAKGKIAVVEVQVPKVPKGLIFDVRNTYPEGLALPGRIENLVIASVLKGPRLTKAAKAGAAGVICVWKGLSSENGRGQYLPFTSDYKGCPALWVDEETGERLKALASEGASARLTLTALKEPGATSSTLWAVIPGQNPQESLIINTHTDGPNAAEENGAVGLIALAHYFASLPQSRRERSLVFLFATGHFQLPQFTTGGHNQASSRWLQDHKELWDGREGHVKAVAGVTIEHLGCMEWKDDAETKAYGPTGEIDMELVYTGNQTMERIYSSALEGRSRVRSITLRPHNRLHFGEGQPLYEAGIPSISLVTAPDYLCKVSASAEADKLDMNLIYEQVMTFLTILEALDKEPKESLGSPQGWSYVF